MKNYESPVFVNFGLEANPAIRTSISRKNRVKKFKIDELRRNYHDSDVTPSTSNVYTVNHIAVMSQVVALVVAVGFIFVVVVSEE